MVLASVTVCMLLQRPEITPIIPQLLARNHLENSLTRFPFLFTSMTYAMLHEDMQKVKLGVGDFIHYHHSIFPRPSFHFSSHLPFMHISFPTFIFQ
jgi:hypothetical protein